MDAPADPDSLWSAKDHLAHLAWWRNRAADTLNAARTGRDVPAPVDETERNAQTYMEHKDRSAAEIKEEARASWDRLEQAVEACSEEELIKPHPVQPDRPLWDSASGNYAHLGNHLMFWHMDSNREKAAESAAMWAYEVDGNIFGTPKTQAYAAYNLACFYARAGSRDRALPLLRHGFEGAPNLVDYARTDPDLESIRNDPRFMELLEG